MSYRHPQTHEEAVEQGKEIYRRCFGEDFPKTWTMRFGVKGFCDWNDLSINVSSSEPWDAARTLVHEFIHQRNPRLKESSKKFQKLEQKSLEMLFGARE